MAAAAARGAAAELVGVAVMTVAEKLEQSVTHRPDSYVAGRTSMTLLGGHPGDVDRPWCGTTPCTGGLALYSARCAECGPRSGCGACRPTWPTWPTR